MRRTRVVIQIHQDKPRRTRSRLVVSTDSGDEVRFARSAICVARHCTRVLGEPPSHSLVQQTFNAYRYYDGRDYQSPNSASWSTDAGRIRGMIASESGIPDSRRILTSSKLDAGSTTVPSPDGINNNTSFIPIPVSRSRSVEWVLVSICRVERRWMRANI